MDHFKAAVLIDDESLAKRIAQVKDTAAFEEIYKRYAKKVFNKCLGFVKNENEAKDLTHDIFLKLFTSVSSFKGNAKFSTWLFSLTYNHCLNYLNRDKGAQIERNSFDIDNYQEKIEEIEDEDLFRMQEKQLVLALDMIKYEERVLLLLKYQDDASIKEIQEIYEIGSSAVKMRINRAKLNLVKAYQSLENEN